MTPAPNRRWFRFRLRTLFVVVTAGGCWLGYELDWIRQRRAVLARHNSESVPLKGPKGFRAPGLLWLFGEQPRAVVPIHFSANSQRPLTDEERNELQRIARLFPEAEVEAWAGPLE